MPRKKSKDLNRKEPVRLRQKRLKNGGYSLYLDIYWNGKRSYDFLKLYLNPPTDDLAVMENKTSLKLAKQITYKRIQRTIKVWAVVLITKRSRKAEPSGNMIITSYARHDCQGY